MSSEGEITMNWENILKRKNKKLNLEGGNTFNKFVKDLTDGLIDRKLQDHLSRTTSDDPQYKNHETALKEVLYNDLSDNIAERLEKAIEEVVFEEGTVDYDDREYASSSGILVLIEAIDKNEKELESKNLEW